jgi:hypothetical protein
MTFLRTPGAGAAATYLVETGSTLSSPVRIVAAAVAGFKYRKPAVLLNDLIGL